MAKCIINKQVDSSATAGTFTIGGDLTVDRLEQAAMASLVRAFGPPPLMKSSH